MKILFRYFLLIVLFTGGNFYVSGVFANVDVTNSFDFTYDCTQTGGVLHTTFSLGGHHFYQRDYRIDKPGVIQIADTNHVTTSKASNISINGCNFTPSSCNVTNWSDWTLVSLGTVSRDFTINTDGSITKSGTTLVIHAQGNDKTQVTGFNGSVYTSIGTDVTLNFLNNRITLEEDGPILRGYTFTNNIYSGIQEYYYEFSSNNTNVKLEKNIFKRIGDGTTQSSTNTYDTFSAFQGSNYSPSYTDISLSSYPDAQGAGYVTGLNYWDYNQHNYTTTKVNLYPVSVTCQDHEYSDGNNNIISDAYPGTLGGIIQPGFSGPIKINGISEQPKPLGISIFSTSGIHLEGLKYLTVGEVGGIKIGVDGIEFTVKKNAITLGKQKLNIVSKTTPGEFSALDFNNLQDASGNAFSLTNSNIYNGEIVLYSGLQIVGTYSFPIAVVANNNLRVDFFTITGNNSYANNGDAYVLCSNIVDSFGNTVNATYDVGGQAWFSGENFDIDLIISGFQGEGLSISNATFNNSQFCFNLTSTVPGEKSVNFKIKIPQHFPDVNLSQNGSYLEIPFTNLISFKKPFIGNLSVITSPFKLLLGTMLTMQLGVEQKSTLSSYNIEQFKNQVNLTDAVNHGFQNLTGAVNLSNNPTIDFRINAKTDAGTTLIPKISIAENPIIFYTLGGQNIRYRLSATDSSADLTDISILGIAMNNTLKVVGSLQGQGKQSVVGQKTNFSDISKSDMRSIIRKNAYTLIRGMTSGQIVNGVKYIEGNATLSGEPLYETLVVKNGNLTISDSFNTNGKKFGIIVLRDNATRTDFGNIYIQPGVRYIQSAIYADGGIISSGFKSGEDLVGNYKDSTMRTNTLNKQLIINGALFTRNTIGGSILGTSGKYILPGGSLTTDFNLAMMYDLNYLRRGNQGYDVSGVNGTRDYNKGNIDSIVIISNPNLQRDPPKGFKN